MAIADETDGKLLRLLCMDSRMPAKEMAKKLGVSEVTLRARTRKLESKLGLRHTLELDPVKAGIPFRSIIVAKLKHRPEKEKLIQLLRRTPIPQFAAICDGEFNLFLYTAAVSHPEYMQWQYSFRAAYEDELVFWKPSHVLLERQGLFPLRKELIARLSLEKPQPQILSALNENSRASLPEVARKTGLRLSTVQYHFNKMTKSGLIRRFTSVVQKPPKLNFIASFLTFTYGKRHQQYSEEVRQIIMSKGGHSLLDKHVSVIESDGAYDGLLMTSFEDANEGYGHVAKIERIFEGMLRADSALMTEPVFGLPPFRSMDLELAYDDTDWTQKGRK